MEERVDVVVVGAGPVGLLCAIELTLGGARVVVLERLGAASTAMKALGIGPIGSEALQRRGMAAAIAAAETRTLAAMARFGGRPAEREGAVSPGRGQRFSGHFAGLSLIRTSAQTEPERRSRMLDQPALEAVLADRAAALGIEVRRERAVSGFAQGADEVALDWTSPRGDGGRLRCRFLVGCDGGRSLVRKQAGFGFPGTPPTLTLFQAVAEIDHPERLLPAGWHRTAGGVFAFGPVPGRLFMLDFSGPPEDRDAPVGCREIEAALRRISGADVRVLALQSASRWTDNTRLADDYRSGRVLLAGDAAHVHSPFGGQGLSLGLGDAANLGWKLAAVVRGEMPDSLLDSYAAERRPVAEAVLLNTLAQVAIMRPDPQAAAMRNIVADLMRLDDVNRFFGEMMSGVSVRYDLGPARNEVGRLLGDRPAGGAMLFDLMQDGRGVLLDASAGKTASRLVAAAAPGIRCVAAEGGPSMLVRPDACVAWAGDGDETDGLADALHRWFVPAPPD